MEDLKKILVDYTTKKGTYVPDVTDELIKNLITNIELQGYAEADLKERGLMVNISTKAKPYYQINPSKNVVHDCIKTTQSIFRQLGISPDAILKYKDDKDSDSTGLSNLQNLLKGK